MNRDGLAFEPALRHHRVIFAIIVALLCAAFALAFADAQRPLNQAAAFFPSVVTVVFSATIATSYLVFVHGRLAGRSGLPWLAGAYLFAAAIAVAQLLAYPGGWSPEGIFGSGAQTSAWLWVFGQAGFAALILVSQIMAGWQRYRSANRPARVGRIQTIVVIAVALALAVEAVLLATRWQASLSEFGDPRTFEGLWASFPGAACVGLSALALLATIVATQGRTVLDLGLILAVASALADVLLTLRGGASFSLGWYAGRCAAVITAVALLVAYLREVGRLHARAVKLGERLAEQAAVDAITGLSNRRHLNRQLELALRDARRRGEDVSLVLFDIDHFNAYNQRYGHLAGEDCLRRIGGAVASMARRPQDVIARYGSEEFAVLLPGTGNDGALHVASVVRDAVHQLAMEHSANPPSGIVTISAGAATVASGGRMDDLIRRADRALHAAKEAGRDRVVTQDAAFA